jgi:S-adenosylmethionine synthetase
MSKITSDHIFTSESVSEGHPDKVCDQISDAVLDACLEKDPNSRVACETLLSHDTVVNAGEITCDGWEKINTEKIARNVIKEIGYNSEDLLFWDQSFKYLSRIHGQSPDISQGVSEGKGLFKEQGAGDQGMMFGYASSETPELMPAPMAYSNRVLNHFIQLRKDGTIPYLRPDSKSQVSVKYKNGKPVEITNVVLSHQTDDIELEKVRSGLVDALKELLEPTGLLTANTKFYINPTGKFILGGPYADAGLTGRKIIVDTYGGVGSHGGGAFSGKDPSKVDRSAAYYCRYVTKNIVAAGLAEKCEVQVAYAIGVADPVSINVETYGTSNVDVSEIQKLLESKEIFDFRPAAIIDELNLLEPKGWSYRATATGGHFGRDMFPWEKTDKAEELKNLLLKEEVA